MTASWLLSKDGGPADVSARDDSCSISSPFVLTAGASEPAGEQLYCKLRSRQKYHCAGPHVGDDMQSLLD